MNGQSLPRRAATGAPAGIAALAALAGSPPPGGAPASPGGLKTSDGQVAGEAACPSGNQPRTFVIELPEGTPIVTGNTRMHYHAKNRVIRNLHEVMRSLVRGRAQITVPVHITVEYASPPRLRAKRHPLASECILDHDNLWPTYKACADGLVRAGLLAGDTKRYVGPGNVVLADETHPRGLVRVTISEVA
jgi:hypothetical protein